MDFTLSPDIEDIRLRTRAFVEEHVLPLEADRGNYDDHENIRLDLLDRARAKRRAAGLWAPQAPKEYGGMGLPIVAWAAMYEEANRSIFGPVCFNCAAPDDGNMNLLALVGSPAQKDRWLRPDRRGQGALRLRHDRARARRRFRSRHDPHPRREEGRPLGHPRPQVVHHRRRRRRSFHPDVRAPRTIRAAASPLSSITATSRAGASCGASRSWGRRSMAAIASSIFDGLEVADENVLMGVGDGLRITQIRLGPARLTHCMRWLGLAKRCCEIAQAYVEEREGFGIKLADRESVQIKLGEVAHQIQIGRLLVMHAAWMLDQGDRARKEVSMAKVQVADTLHQAADVAIQLNGARGYSKDTILEWIYRYAARRRAWSTAPTEVHKMVLARFMREEGRNFGGGGAVTVTSPPAPHPSVTAFLDHEEGEEGDRQAGGDGVEHAGKGGCRRGGVRRERIAESARAKSAGRDRRRFRRAPARRAAPQTWCANRLRPKLMVPTAMPSWWRATEFCTTTAFIDGIGPKPSADQEQEQLERPQRQAVRP